MSVTDIYQKMPTWQQIIAAWRPTNCVLHIYSKTPLPLTIWFFITPKYGDFLEQKHRRGWISSKIVCKDSTFCIKVLRIKKQKCAQKEKGKLPDFYTKVGILRSETGIFGAQSRHIRSLKVHVLYLKVRHFVTKRQHFGDLKVLLARSILIERDFRVTFFYWHFVT